MIYVVGGGPAGRMAALRLAAVGREVTILEKRALGGQCVHDGCMLVCGLNDVARSLGSVAFLRKSGVVAGEVSVCYPEVIRKLEEIQGKLSHILERETLEAGAHVEYGVTATMAGRKLLVNREERSYDAVILATGAQMYVPEVPGRDLCGVYTARTIRSMPELPKRMVIVGGGITAAEFAYIFASFGVRVEVVARSRVLGMLSGKMREGALRDLREVKISENCTLEEIRGESGRVTGVVAGGRVIPCDAVLFATGFVPASPDVTGFATNPDGSLRVDDRMETSVPGVYACGDVLGAPYFTPVSRLQGFAAADAILGKPRTVDISHVPFTVVLGFDYTVFPDSGEGAVVSSPNIAGPGTFWHVADGSVGMMSLTVAPEDGRILGFSSSGPGTGVIGTYLGYLVRKGVTVHEFSPMLEVHPISDGLYSLIRFADGKFP